MEKPRALVTGIYGQDGSYLAELLSAKGYEVHGVERTPLTPHAALLAEHLERKGVGPVRLHPCRLGVWEEVRSLLEGLQPAECYHLAAAHHSSDAGDGRRFQAERDQFHDNIVPALNLFAAIGEVSPRTRLVFAASCLMFEDAGRSPQDEGTPYASRSVYGISKITCSRMLAHYRAMHGLHLSAAILYNHESPRRQEMFVSRKIVSGLVKLRRNEIPSLPVGDLAAVRDWGYAKDYVRGMWLMAQQERPGDYILASGEAHTVRDFVDSAARRLGIEPDGRVREDRDLVGPQPGTVLVGDAGKAERVLGWQRSVDFSGLVDLMIENELTGALD